jgi:hypothetical protein
MTAAVVARVGWLSAERPGELEKRGADTAPHLAR